MPATLTPLYPLQLEIQTPYGLAVLPAPPPTVLQARHAGGLQRRAAITGRVLLTLPQSSADWTLTLAIPERNGVLLDVAYPLQQCREGDPVTITENYTDRTRLRVWTARVTAEDAGAWIAGNPQDGDRFTLQMQFFSTGPT